MKAAAKVKSCKQCGSDFIGWNSLQKVCSNRCAIQFTQSERKERHEAEFRRETKRRKDRLNQNDRKWLLKETQRYFNRFIRLRDRHQPCIVCGSYGGAFDAGHFLSTGSHPEFRFNEFNCHAEHSTCNRGAAKSKINDRTHDQKYEANLRIRIGDSLVDWLKNKPYEPANYTVDDLQWLLAWYKYRCKEIEND